MAQWVRHLPYGANPGSDPGTTYWLLSIAECGYEDPGALQDTLGHPGPAESE